MGQGVPAEARVTIGAVCAAGVLCAAPALRTTAPWPAIAVLAVLYAVCEPGVLPERFFAGRPSFAAGPFVPALLAGALLLPPAAAALVAVPGSLAGRGVPWLRRCWRAGYLAVAAWTASLVAGLLGGRSAVRAADLPYAVLPAALAALALCVAGIALTGAVLVTAERCRPGAAWLDPLPGALVPHLAYGMVALTTALLWNRGCGVLAAALVPLPMYAACRYFARARRVASAHQATVRALVQAVDLKDPYTRGHSERVGRGSAMIARELGLPDERVDALRLAGILHDIGKLGVPTRILRKAGPLTPDERRAIERHPEYGHAMTRGIAFLDDARAAILHHHERLDGSGYPDGLSGEQIPRSARIVAVADAFDAMTSTRSYRPARPVPEALAELDRCAGAHFDPSAVAALARAVRARGEAGPTGPGEAGAVGAPGEDGRPAEAGRSGAGGTRRVAGSHRVPGPSAVDRAYDAAGASGVRRAFGAHRGVGGGGWTERPGASRGVGAGASSGPVRASGAHRGAMAGGSSQLPSATTVVGAGTSTAPMNATGWHRAIRASGSAEPPGNALPLGPDGSSDTTELTRTDNVLTLRQVAAPARASTEPVGSTPVTSAVPPGFSAPAEASPAARPPAPAALPRPSGPPATAKPRAHGAHAAGGVPGHTRAATVAGEGDLCSSAVRAG